MKQVFLDIQAQLLATITQSALAGIGIQTEQPITVELFNNQIARIKALDESRYIPKSYPFIIVGFVSPLPFKQLGMGYQMIDPLIIRIHIMREFYDAGDGTNDQDLIMFDLRNL